MLPRHAQPPRAPDAHPEEEALDAKRQVRTLLTTGPLNYCLRINEDLSVLTAVWSVWTFRFAKTPNTMRKLLKYNQHPSGQGIHRWSSRFRVSQWRWTKSYFCDGRSRTFMMLLLMLLAQQRWEAGSSQGEGLCGIACCADGLGNMGSRLTISVRSG